MGRRRTCNPLPDDAIVCNCAGCDRELWGAAMARTGDPTSHALPPGVEMLGGRLGGRPYCCGCLYARPAPPTERPAPDPSFRPREIP